MFDELSRMIDEEVGLDASANRKALLKTMADALGNLAAAVAQLRMFLLTGDASNKNQFDTLFGNFAKAADALAQQQQIFSKTQAESFGKIAKARSEFSPITDRLFRPAPSVSGFGVKEADSGITSWSGQATGE